MHHAWVLELLALALTLALLLRLLLRTPARNAVGAATSLSSLLAATAAGTPAFYLPLPLSSRVKLSLLLSTLTLALTTLALRNPSQRWTERLHTSLQHHPRLHTTLRVATPLTLTTLSLLLLLLAANLLAVLSPHTLPHTVLARHLVPPDPPSPHDPDPTPETSWDWSLRTLTEQTPIGRAVDTADAMVALSQLTPHQSQWAMARDPTLRRLVEHPSIRAVFDHPDLVDRILVASQGDLAAIQNLMDDPVLAHLFQDDDLRDAVADLDLLDLHRTVQARAHIGFPTPIAWRVLPAPDPQHPPDPRTTPWPPAGPPRLELNCDSPAFWAYATLAIFHLLLARLQVRCQGPVQAWIDGAPLPLTPHDTWHTARPTPIAPNTPTTILLWIRRPTPTPTLVELTTRPN